MIETRLGDFEEVILLMTGILGEDAYSFRMAAAFKEQTGRSVSIGSVHAALERLEDKGYVNSSMGNATAERGGRRKRVFRITALGQRVLKESQDFRVGLWQQFPGLQLPLIESPR